MVKSLLVLHMPAKARENKDISPPHGMYQLQKPYEKLLSAAQSCGYKTDGQVKKETHQATISH